VNGDSDTRFGDDAVSGEEVVQELLNRPCLAAIAQPETGGDLLLHFGGWQPYEDPPNPRVLTSERGKWSLMLCCPWRLDGPRAPICDWRSVADSGKQSQQPYLVLEGLTIEAVELIKPGLDLRLHFARGFRLSALCDSVGSSDDCWYLLRPDDSSIAATRDFRLLYEPPAPSD